MQFLKFIVLLLLAHPLLMQVFRLSTYHAYFWKALPLLLTFSGLVGWLFYLLKLHEFFIWYVVLESVWLVLISRKQSKAMEGMLLLAGDDAELVRGMATSTAKTKAYYALSSFAYIIALSITYLYLYNR